MPIIRRHQPVLDGGPVVLSGGAAERHITIEAGAYPTPCWVRLQPSGVVVRVDLLPWRYQGLVSDIEVLSYQPGASGNAFTRGAGANEPAGYTKVFQLNTASVDQQVGNDPALDIAYGAGVNQAFYGGGWDDPARTLFGVSDPEVDFAVIEQRWPDGAPTGRAGLCSIKDFLTGRLRRMYVRFVFKLSPTWEHFPSAGSPKLYYLKAGADLENIGGVTVYGANPVSRYHLFKASGAGELNEWLTQEFLIGKGEWIDFEAVFVSESAAGAQDGTFEFYHNGVQVASYIAVGGHAQPRDRNGWTNDSDVRWRGIEIGPYWGGSGRNKTVSPYDWLRMGELYISGSTT